MSFNKDSFVTRFFSLFYKRKFESVGENLQIKGKIKIGKNVSVGNNVMFSVNSALVTRGKGKITIGDNVYFNSALVVATNKVTIGNNVIINKGTEILDHDGYGIDGNPPKEKCVKICDNVWIARSCMILKGVKIGENSVVAAKSVVTKDVSPNCLVAGNPAKKIRNISGCTELSIESLIASPKMF